MRNSRTQISTQALPSIKWIALGTNSNDITVALICQGALIILVWLFLEQSCSAKGIKYQSVFSEGLGDPASGGDSEQA